MKTNKYLIKFFTLSLMSILVFSACNDEFMDRFPLTDINDANFFLSPSDLRTYANQFYTNLNNLNAYAADENSDNQCNISSRNTFIWNETTVPVTGGGWGKSDWLPIRRCNYALQRYHTVVGDETEIRRYVGEILFFKAFFYFAKVVQFGDVPWISRDLQTDSEELNAPRDSRKLVMDSVCAIMDRAIEYLPEDISEDRISRYVALILKSRICLYEGTFRKYHGLGDETNMLRQAADASLRIINSNKFALYSTGDPENDLHNFYMLHYAGMRDSREAIFYRNFILDLYTHNRVRECRERGTGMTKDFVESFLCRTDGLPIALSPDYMGDTNYDDEFVNRDFRMKQTIYTSDRPYLIRQDGSEVFEETPMFSTFVSTGYRVYKMLSPLDADNEYQRCEISDPVYRYVEALLNYAEAKAELGECDQTVIDQTINVLRTRVAMPHLTLPVSFTDPNWPDWEVPVTPLINEIRRERRVELACEGFRYRDLQRWKAGRLVNNLKTYMGARVPSTGEFFEVYPGFTRTWNDRLYFYPLPTQELLLNPALTQNPGW